MDPRNDEISTSTTTRRRRRLTRLVLALVCVMLVLWIATPFVASMQWVREKVENNVSEKLGVPVKLQDHSFGWFSGLTLEGFSIGNPEGFSEGDALSLSRLVGDVSLLRLLTGSIDLSGRVEGLRLRVEQRSDGSSNLSTIFGREEQGPSNKEGGKVNLNSMRFDLQLVDGQVDVLIDGAEVESLRALSVDIQKPFDTSSLTLTLGADLHRPDGGTPGRVDVVVDADAAMEKPLVAQLDTTDLDLSRYAPLVSSCLSKGAITALEGVLNGKLDARIEGRERFEFGGELIVSGPKVSGAMLADMTIESPRWVFRPRAVVVLPENGSPTIEVADFEVDLGFASIRGLDAAGVSTLHPAGDALGIQWSLDLGAIAAFGGPVPTDLADLEGTVSGKVALPLSDGVPSTDILVRTVHSETTIAADQLRYGDWTVTGLGSTVRTSDGILDLEITESTRLNGGTLALTMSTDLKDRSALPSDIAFKIDGAKVFGDAGNVLQYFLPILAGFEDATQLQLQGTLAAAGTLEGPVMPNAGQGWLEWANQWTGKGDVGLGSTSFSPAPSVQGLLAAVGQTGRVDLDGFEAPYSISEGAVATNLAKLSKLSKDIGLEGKVSLDGNIDYQIDFTNWLGGHRDGARILKILGDARLTAGLGGTLTAPRLKMPDMQNLLLKAGQNALKNEAQNQADKLLNKGLNKLFGGRKKK